MSSGKDDRTDDLDETRLAPPRQEPLSGATRQEIGSYRLLERIGEGGMGEVWLADQQHPVRRRVALKIIKAGMDTRQVVARFEAERQALAMMDHPSIARIYEAGSTPHGRPYFAMELVPGVPVTEHCDRHRLSIRERLELFLQICEGVQHAHQKAVIHRDLKPSNVLVSLSEGKATPKIIDFGLAKATAQSLTDLTMFTQIGTTIGTPAYMSPEQAELTGQDVDTRTDVYSLGVILYELLVGARPFETPGQVVDRDELLRRIREDEPQRPSSRLMVSSEESAAIAQRRQAQLQQLKAAITGDLDWITIKALEKDRARRYGSPNELAADVRRFLADEPVTARPPSTSYRARKFVRRHRAGVAVAALSLFVLIGFALAMASLASRVARERDRANREAQASERAATFLAQMLSGVNQREMGQALGRTLEERVALAADPTDPTGPRGLARREQLRAALEGVNLADGALHLLDEQVLGQAAQRIEGSLGDDPRLAGRLHATLAAAYAQLGMYPSAVEQAGRALDILVPVEGPNAPLVHAANVTLGQSHARAGEYEQAVDVFRDLLTTYQQTGFDDEQRLLEVRNNLGDALRYAGDLDAAGPMLEGALDLAREVFGRRHIETLATMNNLALVYRLQGRRAEAAALLSEAYQAAAEEFGPQSPDTVSFGGNLGGELAASGRATQAIELLRKTSEQERRLYGDDHYDTMLTVRTLGVAHLLADQPEQAERILEEVTVRMQRVLGSTHRATLQAGLELARAKHAQGRTLDAAASLDRLVATSRSTNSQAGLLADLLMERAKLLNRLDEPARAESDAREALGLLQEDSGATFWLVAAAKLVLAESLLAQDRVADAEVFLSAGYDGLLAAPGEEAKREASVAAARIAAVYDRLGLSDRSAVWRARAADS